MKYTFLRGYAKTSNITSMLSLSDFEWDSFYEV